MMLRRQEKPCVQVKFSHGINMLTRYTTYDRISQSVIMIWAQHGRQTGKNAHETAACGCLAARWPGPLSQSRSHHHSALGQGRPSRWRDREADVADGGRRPRPARGAD